MKRRQMNICIFATIMIVIYSIVFVHFDNIGSHFLLLAEQASNNEHSISLSFFSNARRVYNSVVVQSIFRLLHIALSWIMGCFFSNTLFKLEQRFRTVKLVKDEKLNRKMLLNILLINSIGLLSLVFVTLVIRNQLFNVFPVGYSAGLFILLLLKIIFIFYPYVKQSRSYAFVSCYSVFQILILVGVLF